MADLLIVAAIFASTRCCVALCHAGDEVTLFPPKAQQSRAGAGKRLCQENESFQVGVTEDVTVLSGPLCLQVTGIQLKQALQTT